MDLESSNNGVPWNLRYHHQDPDQITLPAAADSVVDRE
jgi:hypothetical protein